MAPHDGQIARLEKLGEVIFVDRFDIDSVIKFFKTTAKKLQCAISRFLCSGRNVVAHQSWLSSLRQRVIPTNPP